MAGRRQRPTLTHLIEPAGEAPPHWKHQLEAWEFAYPKQAAMLAMDMGTGKTRVVVNLCDGREHNLIAIFCPKSVVPVWPREFRKWATRRYRVVQLNHGSVADRLALAKASVDAMHVDGIPTVLVINHEAAWRDPIRRFFLSTAWDIAVVDESHRIKAPGGKASMFFRALRDHCKYRLCLTGTPMPHTPLDIYAQFRFLDPEIFGSSYNFFKNRYALWGGYQNYQILTYQNTDEMNSKFYSLAFRVGKDVLDLPAQIHDDRNCELEPAAMATYESVRRAFIAQVKEGVITASNALVKLLRLAQIANGYAKTDEGEEIHISSAKQDLLFDLLEDLAEDEPVVVFCRFHHDLDAVHKVAGRLKRNSGELSGRAKSVNDLLDWQEGKFPILAVQLQAGGVGIDLTRSRYAVYYSVDFSLGNYDQSVSRVHRPGQTRTTTYYHLLAQGTVDEEVYDALQKRRDIVQSILDRAMENGDNGHE